MTDREALMAAICAAPEDDTPRLVFADWLEENGEPERAEFIRVQCRIAALSKTDDVEWDGLLWRERELLEAHGHDWVGKEWGQVVNESPSLSAPNGWHNDRFEFRRGFVAALTCTAADWLRVADDVYWHPDQTTSRCPGCYGNSNRPAPKCPVCHGGMRTTFPRPFPTGAGRTVECPECGGHGGHIIPEGTTHRTPANGMTREVFDSTKLDYWRVGHKAKWEKCDACDNGRVPAPAALPHPIEEMQLTTTDWLAWVGPGNPLPTFGGDGAFTDPRWPGILFRQPGGHRPA